MSVETGRLRPSPRARLRRAQLRRASLRAPVTSRAVPASRTSSLARLYEELVLIRRVEETLLELFSAGKLVGTTHTCIGQEADAVGVVSALEPERDVVFSNHRCHGHYLAFTGDVEGLLAEVMGRATGTCGGKGGSQHLCRGNFYSNGVLGSTVPVATGMALAERRKGTGAVAVVFMGDGTLGEGVVYESLNIASLWGLPIVFVVENNFYAQSTPSRLGVAGSIPGRARAFGIETAALATTDVEEVRAAAIAAVDHARASCQPYFLVLDTYRFSPHSKGDDFRDPAEIEERRAVDPLVVAGRALDDDDRLAREERAAVRLAVALEAAELAPAAVPAG